MARLKNIRINEVTGEKEFYYPMEITFENKEFCRISSKQNGYEIGEALLGFRRYKAIFIPVTEEQYRAFIKDELDRQEEQKQDSRCTIGGKNGKIIRCPLRVPNSKYIEGGTEPKTLAVKCEKCPYFNKKTGSRALNFSELNVTTEDGEELLFEPSNPLDYFSADEYERLMQDFLDFISKNKPKLLELATLLTKGYTQTEVSNKLGKSTSTIHSQVANLKSMCFNFLNDLI